MFDALITDVEKVKVLESLSHVATSFFLLYKISLMSVIQKLTES